MVCDTPSGREPVEADVSAEAGSGAETTVRPTVQLWVWGLGLLASLGFMGPALAPGSLLNLDLVLVPNPPVPRGVWGLGPELPRRVPMWVFMAWLSALLRGDLVGKLFVVVALTLAFVGMYRLVSGSALTGLGAAALYAFSPFLLTRVAVGHWMVLWTMALIPWALDALLAPGRSPGRVLLWSAALGVCGVYGGIAGGALVVSGLIVGRGERAGRVLGAFVLGQLPWLVPMVVVGATAPSGSLAASSAFAPSVDGLGGVGRLLSGHGFWNTYFQIGRTDELLGAIAGFAILGLAVLGSRDLPRSRRGPLLALAAISLFVAVSSQVTGLSRAADWFTSTALGAPFRETQRYLLFYFLWAAPAAALGAARLARGLRGAVSGAVLAVPLAIAALLAGPAWWGFAGQLTPVTFPREWATARAIVNRQPGTVVALPWYQYFSTSVADHHLVLDVVPFYFGGDVVISSDPQLSTRPDLERADPRERVIGSLVAVSRTGLRVSSLLAEEGVRWVVLQRDADWDTYRGILHDPGLQRVVDGRTLVMFRVRAWVAEVVDRAGRPVRSSSVVTPLHRVDASGPARWATPAERGWLRGTSKAGEARGGLVALPAGSGWVWYWPVVPVLLADLATLGGIGWVLWRQRRGPPRTARQVTNVTEGL